MAIKITGNNLQYDETAIATLSSTAFTLADGTDFACNALTASQGAKISSALLVAGLNPTLTIGDAGAEDAKMVFDGNAQDFYVGLDDSEDDLVLGVGSALGTTVSLALDENRSVDVAAHNGSVGLKLGGTLVTATAVELNYVDIATLGTAAASKALTIKGDSTWTVAGMTCADIGTLSTADIDGGSIDGAVIGANSAAAGAFTALTASSARITGVLTVDGEMNFGNAAADTLVVKGNSQFTGSFEAAGVSQFHGALSASNGFKFTDGAASNASMVLNDTNGFVLQVATSQISSNTVISGTVNATGNTTLGSALEVEGTSHLNGNVTADNNVDVAGDLTAATITCAGFVVDADGDTNLKSLRVDDNSYIGSDSVTDLIQLQADGDIIVKDGTYDFDIASHDATNGLLLGGVLVSATAAELNYVDIATLGTAAASKALTIKGDSTWTVAGMTCADLGTVTTADINGGSIDGATLGGTAQVTITDADMNGGSIDGTAIGANSAAAGTFTAIIATGAVINGNTAVTGTLNVTSTAHFDSTVDVEGHLTLASTADAKARSFITYSDATLKQDIKPLDSALDKVMSMRGVSYEFKNQATADGSTHREVGFLAQEMKQSVPEVVYGSGDGNLGIDYAKLTSVLVEAVKSQQGQIEELRAALLKK
jgi:hypothetical protein